jgi:shikimate 5-dehydrogenase
LYGFQSYVPSDTALIVQLTGQLGVPSSHVARGLDLLIAQGIFGCQLWMGKTLPAPCIETMERAVREAYAQKHASK